MKYTLRFGLGLWLMAAIFNPWGLHAATPPLDTKAAKATLAHDQDSFLGIPAVPYKVVINRQNTRAFAQSALKIVESQGGKAVVLPLPKQASAVQLSLPDANGTLLAWQTEKAMPYKPQGFIEKQRITYESMANSLGGALTALQAQYSATVDSIAKLPPKEAAAALKEAMPNLSLMGTRMHSTQRDLDVANARALLFKDEIPLSQQLLIGIDTKLAVGDVIRVAYAYTLNGSFWKPVYSINAHSHNDTIDFTLMAEIQQNSDLDWNATTVELSTAQGNEQNPPSVRPWVVSKSESVQARNYNMPMMNKAMSMDVESSSNAMGGFSAQNAVAVWTLKKNVTIPEGHTTLILQEEQIKAPLERIARPSSHGSNKVWLKASPAMTFPFLPVGEAHYLLDGIPVGEDIFAVKDEKMPFFFGVDPLVTVESKKDIRKSDQEGLLNKEQVFTWGWTYTVNNTRAKAVKVLLEEPQTQLQDKAMSVTYTDSPAPVKGEDNTFVWTLDVPAEGKAVVKRSITVKAPKDMPINPGR